MPVANVPSCQDVPLIGQPIVVLGYTVVVALQCRCEQSGYVSLIWTIGQSGQGAGIAHCPSCHRPYHIQSVQEQQGQLLFQIGMGDARPVTTN